MEERRNITDTECLLYGTRACAVLNMRSCKDCPLQGRIADEQLIDDIALFESLLPEEGVAGLFESETCLLCKGEAKGKRSGYAVYDMVHTEPKALRRTGLLSRLLKKQDSGFMVPLQFACCKKCHNRVLLLTYLPIVIPTVLGMLALALAASEQLLNTVRGISQWLPLLVLTAAVLGGYLLGKLIVSVLKKKYEQEQYLSLDGHPFVKRMEARGWRQMFREKNATFLYTKKRIDMGLGTAGSAVYARTYGSEEKSTNAEKAD